MTQNEIAEPVEKVARRVSAIRTSLSGCNDPMEPLPTVLSGLLRSYIPLKLGIFVDSSAVCNRSMSLQRILSNE